MLVPFVRVPLQGTWVQDDGRLLCAQMQADLRLTYEADVLYIDGLRGGQYLSIDLADLLDAMARSLRGEGEPA